MPVNGAASDRAWYGSLAGLFVLKLGVCALVAASGFVALSDDDYSRTVIAQQFAAFPAWDPSGTSWLPLPFWLTGACMRLFGPSFEVARAVAWSCSALSLVALAVVARGAGLSARNAVAGAGLAGLFPYSAIAGAAAVPDGYAAAFMATGMLSLATRGAAGASVSPQRWLGASCLCVSTLSRYESWPVAAVFCLATASSAWRARSLRLAICSGLPGLGPVAWMAHGAMNHGSALFFVDRVSSYQATLGQGPSPWWRLPAAILHFEPELFVLGLVPLVVVARSSSECGSVPPMRSVIRLGKAWLWVALAAFGLMLFLFVADQRQATATHHHERTLLAYWMLVATFIPSAWSRLRGPASRLAARLGIPLLFVALLYRGTFVTYETFAPRTLERDIGARARAMVPSGDPLLVATQDLGYFAVLASFARAEHPDVAVLQLGVSRPVQLERLKHARWAIVPNGSRLSARLLGAGPAPSNVRIVEHNEGFSLLHLERTARTP